MFDFIYPILPLLNMFFFMALVIYIILKIGKKFNKKKLRVFGSILIVYVAFVVLVGIISYFE
ncbi:hypothetical protein CN601_15235 [Bacillus sp. AFS017336]|nr:hypothetical protein CN601_15235 [Bacillus sp. AFS017336]